MALDTTKPIQQQKTPAGTNLIDAGKTPSTLCIAHKGEVAAINKFDESKKRILYKTGANTCVGFSSLLDDSGYLANYSTTAESIISSFPVKGNYSKLIMGKLNVGLMGARSLASEVIASYQSIQRLTTLQAELEKTQDNLSIVYSRCNPNQFKEEGHAEGGLIDPVLTRARVALSAYKDNSGEFPDPITLAWLKADHRNVYDKTYEFTSSFDKEEFQFMRSLLALPTNIQGAMYKANLQILEGLSKKLASLLVSNVHEIYQLQELIDQSMEALMIGENSYAEKLWLTADTLDSGFTDLPLNEFSHIARYFLDSCKTYAGHYKAMQGITFDGISPAYQKLADFISNNLEIKKIEEVENKTTSVGGDSEAIKKELGDSVSKIMNFVQLPAEEQKKMKKGLKDFNSQKNPLDSGGDARKIRKGIEVIYWNIYENAYSKFLENKGNVPQFIKLFLNYGFFDDTLLDDEHLVFLFGAEDSTKSKYPIITSSEWLEKIYKDEEPPSIDEMGQSYFDNIKLEFKDRGFKREKDVPPDVNTPERRLQSELKNFLSSNVRLTTGTPTSAFCMLTRHQITTPIEKAFVTRERLSTAIDTLLNIDYSAFHREVIINDEERKILKEFVQVQVIPWFIRVPSIGTKMMMWQDLAGRGKSSSGRISFPAFATHDLTTMLYESVAAFRWELTKSIMGADWNNVAQSSITSDYTDYSQFFKKNRDLSKDQKEKLAAEFKRFRDDRARFTNDYLNWLKYESQGVLKLNKVCRNIMYKHIPFEKKIRDEISNQPAYAEIHNRFKNIRNRKLREMEVKFRKYEEGGLPAELQSTLDYYKV